LIKKPLKEAEFFQINVKRKEAQWITFTYYNIVKKIEYTKKSCLILKSLDKNI